MNEWMWVVFQHAKHVVLPSTARNFIISLSPSLAVCLYRRYSFASSFFLKRNVLRQFIVAISIAAAADDNDEIFFLFSVSSNARTEHRQSRWNVLTHKKKT